MRAKGYLRGIGYFFLVLSALLLIGPFLIPVPPLENTVPVEQLADADSRFMEVNGVNVHYKTWGEGSKNFILLHGFGASLFSWREVVLPLSEYGKVTAFDRPAFGLTERPLTWQGENPYSSSSQVDIVLGLMNEMGISKAILVGNSAGGTVSMQFALRHPERVEALILVDPAVYAGGGAPSWVRPILHTPQMDRLGPLLARQIQSQGVEFIKTAWHDPSRVTTDILEGYQKPLLAENWDKALWNLTLASEESGLAGKLQEFTMPILVITGDDDRIVPTEQSIRLSEELSNSVLKVIAQSGHLPHEETPIEFMQAVEAFLSELP